VLFPTQIIVTKELDEESHRWLKSLWGKLKKHEMVALLRQIETLGQKFERELADAVLEVSIRANPQIVEELKGEEREGRGHQAVEGGSREICKNLRSKRYRSVFPNFHLMTSGGLFKM
jgi:anion-transporting  ArsA/GET3 family ATPase